MLECGGPVATLQYHWEKPETILQPSAKNSVISGSKNSLKGNKFKHVQEHTSWRGLAEYPRGFPIHEADYWSMEALWMEQRAWPEVIISADGSIRLKPRQPTRSWHKQSVWLKGLHASAAEMPALLWRQRDWKAEGQQTIHEIGVMLMIMTTLTRVLRLGWVHYAGEKLSESLPLSWYFMHGSFWWGLFLIDHIDWQSDFSPLEVASSKMMIHTTSHESPHCTECLVKRHGISKHK